MGGLFVVIDGTDGSGKKTQTEIVVRLLNDLGYRAERVEFPQHGTRSATLVDDYLNGKYGTAEQVGPHIASLFYACDRYDASFRIRKLLEEGVIIVSDRYVCSNMGHQASKFSDPEERDEFLDWLIDLEYRIFKIPQPDINLILYMPTAVSQQLIDKKTLRQYIKPEQQNKDIHERDTKHLTAAAETYLYVAKKYGWEVLVCADDSKPKQIPEITKEIMRVIGKHLEQNAGLRNYLR